MMVKPTSSARLQARAQSKMTTAPKKPPVLTGSIPQRIVDCDRIGTEAVVAVADFQRRKSGQPRVERPTRIFTPNSRVSSSRIPPPTS